MNASKIKTALAYVHHWEKNGFKRAQAAKDAIMINGLSKDESDILLNAIHVKREEIAK